MKHYMLIFGIMLFSACNSSKEQQDNSEGEPLKVDGFVLRDTVFSTTMQTTGTLEANETFPLRAEIQGRVEKLAFNEGDHVKKGQLLAVIDDDELRSELEEITELLELSESNLKRAEQLIEIEGISQQEYDELRSQVAQLKSQKSTLRARIRRSRIYAPYDGIIGLRNISPGAYLSLGDLIATLVQVHPLKLQFTLPEEKAYHISIGDTVIFHVKGVKDSVKARIYARESTIDVATRSMRFRALCIDKDNDLLPGTFTRLYIPLKTISNAVMIPSEALILSINSKSVFVSRDGVAKRVDVVPGYRGPEKIHIEKGLSKGDTLITTGLMKLNDGDAIKLSL